MLAYRQREFREFIRLIYSNEELRNSAKYRSRYLWNHKRATRKDVMYHEMNVRFMKYMFLHGKKWMGMVEK